MNNESPQESSPQQPATKDENQQPSTAAGGPQAQDTDSSVSHSRRAFLAKVTAASVAAGVAGLSIIGTESASAQVEDAARCAPTDTCGPLNCGPGCEVGPLCGTERADKAQKVRNEAALFERLMPIPKHPCNGDEAAYQDRNFFASFTKAMEKINDLGEVNPTVYKQYLEALCTGKPAEFEDIRLGCVPCATPTATGAASFTDGASRAAPSSETSTDAALKQRRLVNPQAGLAFDLEGIDSHQLAAPCAPAFSSAEEIGEIAENYWMALTRDIPFESYGANDDVVQRAADDLNRYAVFRGPKEPSGVVCKVTARTLFRGVTNTTGNCDSANNDDLKGPYVSQLLLHDIPYGAQMIDPRIITTARRSDYMFRYDDWLFIQKGCAPKQMDACADYVYVYNGRSLGQYVHIDVVYQAFFNACLILLTPRKCRPDGTVMPCVPCGPGGWGARFDDNIPYNTSCTQEGFVTFGATHLKVLLAKAALVAHKATWYQKWLVHRRLRPEEFGGRIHNHLFRGVDYPFHPTEFNKLREGVLPEVYNYNASLGEASYLLPQAFPEGSPVHPAYTAGHATLAGACATILKAWFRESDRLVDLGIKPMVSPDGVTRVSYGGADAEQLTVRGELNKLASNIGLGRDIAGVHWRSDHTESLKIGEAVAIKLLEDYGFTYNEDFAGFKLTKFDGTTVTVGVTRRV
jgi:hypothetical protein